LRPYNWLRCGNDLFATESSPPVDHADYQEKAKTEFEEILKQDPGNAGALRGLGYGYLRKQDFDHVREYFAKAVERDAKDPWVLYYSAMLFRQDNCEGFGERNAGAVIMQNRLEKAVELNPEFADAYSLLGFAFIMQGKQEEARKAMVKAVNLNPQNVGYRFNVANLYLQMRKFDRATAVLKAESRACTSKRVLACGNPTVSSANRSERTRS